LNSPSAFVSPAGTVSSTVSVAVPSNASVPMNTPPFLLAASGARVNVNFLSFTSGSPGTYSTDGWDLWGWTSPLKLNLKEGKHKFTLRCESDADNMSLIVNDFMLKGCRLTLDTVK
jgi:hypothetical protein